MRIYLDHNATTPVRAEVADAMSAVLREEFGNPSSVYAEGASARSKIERLTRTLDRPVLISSETRGLIDDSIELVQTDPVAIPGRSGKLVCYYPG